jgi:hypothetical protein
MTTEAEKAQAYDDLMSGRVYFKPQPEPVDHLDLMIKIQLELEGGEPEPQPVGTLPGGVVMYGGFDGTPDQGYWRDGCVSAGNDVWGFTAGTEMFSGEVFDTAVNFDGVSYEQLATLRDFLNSGILEQMRAAAVAWGCGEPPAAPAPPAPPERCGPNQFRETPIGTLESGEIVNGAYSLDSSSGVWKLFSARVMWHGVEIATDGESYISLPEQLDTDRYPAAGMGDVTLGVWALIGDLMRARVVEQLTTLARQHATV